MVNEVQTPAICAARGAQRKPARSPGGALADPVDLAKWLPFAVTDDGKFAESCR
jgi:hypothetical protein